MNHSENLIKLKNTDVFYTKEPADAILVKSGTAIVYIVPYNTETDSPGRRLVFTEVEQYRVIPSLKYRDMDYNEYRFAVVPKEGELELEILPEASTRILKKRFVERANIDNFEQESFENCLIEFYQQEVLKDDIFLRRGVKDEPEAKKKAQRVIKSALKEEYTDTSAESAGELYKAAAFICRELKIKLSGEDRLISLYGTEYTIFDIASESNFICREVVLDRDWYKSDCGALLCKVEGSYAACVPKGRQGYRICRAGSTPHKLGADEATNIEPRAFSIGRALPERALSKKDIISFCRGSIVKSDAVSVVVLGLLINLIGILYPTLNQKIYDDYIPIGKYSMIFQTCVLIVSMMLGKLMFGIVNSLSQHRLSSRVGYDFQNAMYYRIFNLPQSFFRRFDSADLAQRIMQSGSAVNSVATLLLTSVLSCVFSLIYFIRMCTYSVKMSMISLLMIAVLFGVSLVLNISTYKYDRMAAEDGGEAESVLYQYLNAVDKIRMSGSEERTAFRYLIPTASVEQNTIKKNRPIVVVSAVFDAASYIFSMILYCLIIKANMKMSTGSFIAFTAAFGTFTSTAIGLMGKIDDFYGLKVIFGRLAPIFSEVPENNSDKESVSDISGGISVENVSFSYEEGGRQVLDNLSLTIPKGEYLAVVGASGCGKSTLLKLLLGFEKPTVGKICYDGKDLDTLDKKSVRRKMGVVLQNGSLISGSIYDNITITADHPTKKDVDEVIEAVGLKDDIAAMPMGIHTVLSESGSTISGGQQQRILIARSIISRPRILFFDEATSALDNITQAKVCESLDKLNMTRVVIAHRLSTIKNCTRIIVLKDGRIAEEGNYDSLMAKRGLFYKMAERQLAE